MSRWSVPLSVGKDSLDQLLKDPAKLENFFQKVSRHEAATIILHGIDGRSAHQAVNLLGNRMRKKSDRTPDIIITGSDPALRYINHNNINVRHMTPEEIGDIFSTKSEELAPGQIPPPEVSKRLLIVDYERSGRLDEIAREANEIGYSVEHVIGDDLPEDIKGATVLVERIREDNASVRKSAAEIAGDIHHQKAHGLFMEPHQYHETERQFVEDVLGHKWISHPDAAGNELRKLIGRDSQIRVKTPGRRYIIVDDNEDNRDILEALLQAKGKNAKAYGDPQQAIERVGPEDVLLLDIMMPHMNGFEVADRLRPADGENKVAGILIQSSISGEDMAPQFLRQYQMGQVNGAIAKPLSAQRVVAELESLEELIDRRGNLPKPYHPDQSYLIILSGLRAAGKSTIWRAFLKQHEVEEMGLVKYTSRPIRPGEELTDQVHLSKAEMRRRNDRGEFAFMAEHENRQPDGTIVNDLYAWAYVEKGDTKIVAVKDSAVLAQGRKSADNVFEIEVYTPLTGLPDRELHAEKRDHRPLEDETRDPAHIQYRSTQLRYSHSTQFEKIVSELRHADETIIGQLNRWASEASD